METVYFPIPIRKKLPLEIAGVFGGIISISSSLSEKDYPIAGKKYI